MTDAQVIALINQYIVTNGNNEITAAVLNPILQAIRQRSQDVTGDPEDLTTTDTSNLVAAINSIQSEVNDFEFEGVQVYSGLDNPNDTPPLTYNVADFYKQLDGDGDTIELFQYNGTSWVSYEIEPEDPVTVCKWKKIIVTAGQETAGEIQDTDFIDASMDYIMSKAGGFMTEDGGDYTFDSATGTITIPVYEGDIFYPHYTK